MNAAAMVPAPAVAGMGEIAIGRMGYQRPHVASQPVSLAPRPVFLAGREELFGELDTRLSVAPGDPVALVHAVLAADRAGRLVVFDNAPDRASVERFLPSAGPAG